ncbi:MAG: hypothetical protein AAGK14_02610 [Verrucomicrobiota bacterium]
MPWLMHLLLLAYAAVAIYCTRRLWATAVADSFWRKLIWSCVIMIPFFGVIFYGAWYRPLSSSSVKAEADIVYGGGHVGVVHEEYGQLGGESGGGSDGGSD